VEDRGREEPEAYRTNPIEFDTDLDLDPDPDPDPQRKT
jgi:hypothetical protein